MVTGCVVDDVDGGGGLKLEQLASALSVRDEAGEKVRGGGLEGGEQERGEEMAGGRRDPPGRPAAPEGETEAGGGLKP